MRETDPQVELIARPQIDVEALGRYLKTVAGERWLEARLAQGETNPGEMLVEAAGRACYRSWEPGLNPNVKRIRSDQKEYFLNILRSGHGSVLEHANYTFVIWDVSRVFCYDEETEVLTSEGWVPFPKIAGDELFGTLNPDTGELEYQPAEQRFVGRYSGPMYRVKSEQIDLLVTPNHRMWARKLDTPAESAEPFRVHLVKDVVGQPVAYQKSARPRAEEASGLIREFLTAILEAGARGGDSVIRTASKEAADDLQILAIKAGWTADVSVDDRKFPPRFQVSLDRTGAHPVIPPDGRKHDSFVHYDGEIHCVKVPNGLLFVRRNGKPCVSSNTHELVRHRAGSAFSQESMRFVRVDDVGFRIPESMEPMRTEIIQILETLEDFQIKAAERFGLDDEGVPFHTKKEMTSAMRRLAPEGISTMIVWTANVRTLRHVIQARTDPGAEEELRYVFHKIGKIMAAEAPLLFGDFVVENGAWKTEYKKV